MKKRAVQPILGTIFRKIAPRIGAKVIVEPKWKIVGQVTFRNGKRRYFRYSSSDLNPLGASSIAQDKDYANFFMKRMGYPTVRGEAFLSDDWAKMLGSRRNRNAAFRFAKKLGLPVIVKPNSGSQGGNVQLVHSPNELRKGLRTIFKRDRVALVQKYVSGRDYRIVVLDDKIISAYERIPLNVTGDGHSTIARLLQKKQKTFIASSRDTQLKADDPRIRTKLRHQGLSLTSVLKTGAKVFLLDNANLSTGGDSVEVKRIHPEFAKLAIKLTKDMGLRLCGVDLMVEGTLEEKPKKFWVLEVNAAPGLDHYARSGKAQEKIVEEIYLKVLKSLEY
ncbi:MAG: cyanophycin synthetase [Parcubacteria group bacterium GW2011_GWA2_49_9]|nr:MAG: cyanophycin synthetase [Parcubacteria group bacterium GW2011_GWA2_49_9]